MIISTLSLPEDLAYYVMPLFALLEYVPDETRYVESDGECELTWRGAGANLYLFIYNTGEYDYYGISKNDDNEKVDCGETFNPTTLADTINRLVEGLL